MVKHGWKMYLNSATNVVAIEMEGNAAIESLEAIDLTGRILLSKQGDESVNKLTITDLNNGAYIVRIGSQGVYWTRSLIVQK